MRALVTGDRGFLGTAFREELQARGWTVCGADIVDGKPAEDVFSGKLYSGIVWDLVIHCAAVAPHREAIDRMPLHYTRNLALDSAMFGWAVDTGQERVLYISSSAAYPIGLQLQPQEGESGHQLREFDANPGPAQSYEIVDGYRRLINCGRQGYPLLQPDAGYGRLKADGERMAEEANAAGVTVSVVRPFSGYGTTQRLSWPFGAFVDRAKRRADPFEIWGDGSQVRDWVHVTDVVKAALAISDAGHREPVNICTGIGTSMADTAERIATKSGYLPTFHFRLDKPAGVSYRVGDPTELYRFYRPEITLAEGIRMALK